MAKTRSRRLVRQLCSVGARVPLCALICILQSARARLVQLEQSAPPPPTGNTRFAANRRRRRRRATCRRDSHWRLATIAQLARPSLGRAKARQGQPEHGEGRRRETRASNGQRSETNSRNCAAGKLAAKQLHNLAHLLLQLSAFRRRRVRQVGEASRVASQVAATFSSVANGQFLANCLSARAAGHTHIRPRKI